MSKYTDLLKSPEWQKKRLKIMDRDNWECQACHDEEEMLTVHHKYYKKGLLPWEYPDKCYITLCDTCHKQYHKDEKEIIKDIVQRLKESGILLHDFYSLAVAFSKAELPERKLYFLGSLEHIILDKSEQQKAMETYSALPISKHFEYSIISQND